MPTIAPDHANVPYGPHPRQVLDLWLPAGSAGSGGSGGGPRKAVPLYLYIHGGGYAGGDKNTCDLIILQGLLERGVGVAAMNYRFRDDPEYLAPLLDGASALQFLRQQGGAWGIDPGRIAAGGGSAGAATAFYLGLCPDRAHPHAADPRLRQSTRLQCIAAWEAQTSLDPRYIRSIIKGPSWTLKSIQDISKLTFEQYDTPLAAQRFDELAFTRHVGPDSPPTFVFNVTPDVPMTDDLEIGPGIHHPEFGRDLKRMMDRVGVECVVRWREELPELSDVEVAEAFFRDLVEFVVRHIGGAR